MFQKFRTVNISLDSPLYILRGHRLVLGVSGPQWVTSVHSLHQVFFEW